MTTAADLYALVYEALAPSLANPSPTSAADRVDRVGIMPTQPDGYPRIKLRIIGETKQSQGRGSIGFMTTPTIRIIGEASAPVSVDDPSVSNIEAQLQTLKREIECAVINSYPLFAAVQQLLSIQTQLSYDAQATMLAGVQSDYTFEIYEDADDFTPIPAIQLAAIDARLPANGPGFDAILPQ